MLHVRELLDMLRNDSAPAIRATVARSGTRWEAEIPSLAGARVWAWTPIGLDQAVRDAVAVELDLTEDAASQLRVRLDY